METLRINGKVREFEAGAVPGNILLLLELLGIDSATVVAELDGKIIERKDFGSTSLRAGQSLELIRFVGGG